MNDDLLLHNTMDFHNTMDYNTKDALRGCNQARVIAMQPINSIFCLWYRRRREGFIFWVLVFAFF